MSININVFFLLFLLLLLLADDEAWETQGPHVKDGSDTTGKGTNGGEFLALQKVKTTCDLHYQKHVAQLWTSMQVVHICNLFSVSVKVWAFKFKSNDVLCYYIAENSSKHPLTAKFCSRSQNMFSKFVITIISSKVADQYEYRSKEYLIYQFFFFFSSSFFWGGRQECSM